MDLELYCGTIANGWVAAGLIKTREILLESQVAGEMSREIEDLMEWTQEIMNEVAKHQASVLLTDKLASHVDIVVLCRRRRG